ncbi:MAG TPA: DegT/DnrJ/EryC1/StrS family aminotransferase [Acidimicrobiales bacterium]|jgi:CDP-6-deoxy-D-xylo-4-hexulose-3-dehydrase|nr:DegT/DnrJ/EryC1/StrS family aminotransferase [Acidimicrobiales bacterium]
MSGSTRHRITEAGPVHDEREIEAVVEVLRSGLLDLGPRVAEFERRGAELLAKQYGVMVNSGTSALWLAVDLLGCERGDEVITSPLTFSSDIAPLVRSGIVPVFVDVEPDTFQIDVDGIEAMIGPRTKAILTPNLVGNCPDWDRIREIADRHGLLVVEDSCDVLDSYLRGTRTGLRADIVVTSFARSHSMTAAGNGGLIAVNDRDWHDQTLMRRRWGRRSETYLFGSRKGDDDRFGPLADGTPYDLLFVFDDMGYNFEPSEIMAAYGLVQMDKVPEFNRRRQATFRALDDVLVKHEEKITRPRTTDGVDTTWMRYPFLLADGIDRTAAQEFFLERNIPTRMVWTGNILRQPGFAHIEHRAPAGGLPNTDRVMDRSLSLPTHHGLTSDDVGHMVESLGDWLASF